MWLGEVVKTSVSYDLERIIFHFEKDEFDDETISKLRFSMTGEDVYVDLNGAIAEEIHPDIIALCTILLCNPFIGKEIHFPLPISRQFFDSASSVISRYSILSEVDENLPPNSNLVGGRPSLAFSGGADSCAALAIMPGNTVPVFLNRAEVIGTKYNPDAPLKICNKLKDAGFEANIVGSNLELLRSPVGFPTDLANGIPALILSKHLGLDSIAFGTVLESAYGIGHENYIDYKNGAHWRFFSTLFSAAGVDLCMPTVGISEVGTAIIGSKSSIAKISQSCIRGAYSNPCLKCWKCFRKQLLGKSMELIGDVDFAGMMESNEVQVRLSSFPISHENVVTFSLQRLPILQYPFFKPLIKKLDMDIDLSLLENWFSESIFHIPKKYRIGVREKILSFLEPMDISQEYVVKTWDCTSHLDKKETKIAQNELTTFWQDFKV